MPLVDQGDLSRCAPLQWPGLPLRLGQLQHGDVHGPWCLPQRFVHVCDWEKQLIVKNICTMQMCQNQEHLQYVNITNATCHYLPVRVCKSTHDPHSRKYISLHIARPIEYLTTFQSIKQHTSCTDICFPSRLTLSGSSNED